MQKMTASKRLLTALVVSSLLCLTARGQQSGPLPLDDVIRLKTLQNAPVVSRDGRKVAYTVKTRPQLRVVNDDEIVRSGRTPHEFGSDIFVYDRATKEERNLTAEQGSNWAPSWSPDSRYLAFLSDRDGSEQPKLWLWDSGSKTLKKIADAAARIWGVQQIAWSNNGQKIFVAAIPGQMTGAQYLERMERSGSAQKAGMASGSTVVLYTSRGGLPQGRARASGNTLAIDDRFRDLLMIDVATGETTTVISDERISEFYVTRDDRYVVFSNAKGLEASGAQQILYDLVVHALDTGRNEIVAKDVPLDYFGRFSVSPDSSWVAYKTNPDSPSLSDLFVVSMHGGEPRNLTHFEVSASEAATTGNWKRNFSVTPVWSSDSQLVYFIAWRQLWQSSIATGVTLKVGEVKDHSIAQLVSSPDNVLESGGASNVAYVVARDEWSKREGIFSINLGNGRNTEADDGQHCLTCEAARDARYVAGSGSSFTYVAEDAEHPADLWETDLVTHKTSRLSHLNPQFDNYKMGTPQLVDWLDDDGHRLRGALLLPSDYESGKRYPMIVLVYGGDLLSGSINRFGGYERGMPYFHPQLFATRGYIFFAPDAPQKLGEPMFDLAKTILPGVNKVIEMGIAHPDRLGIMGHSYGGYSTLSLLVETQRFKAAVEADGMADLIAMYGEMNKDGTVFGTSSETGQEFVGGSPWEVRDRYIENSPLFEFDRIETPLLVIHGGDDNTIAPYLGDEIFVALRRLGKTVDYAKYEGEAHSVAAYANQVDLGNRVIRWFDHYLKPADESGRTAGR